MRACAWESRAVTSGSKPNRSLVNDQRLEERRANHLVACLHVREVQIREHVGQEGQESVADGVPEVQHPVIAAEKARAEHRVGLAECDRLHQSGKLGGIVLEVRILDHDHVAGGLRNAGAERGALAAIDRMMHGHVHRPFPPEPVEDGRGLVARAIVHHHDLEVERHPSHPLHNRGECLVFVVGGNHDGKTQRFHREAPVSPEPASTWLYGQAAWTHV